MTGGVLVSPALKVPGHDLKENLSFNAPFKVRRKTLSSVPSRSTKPVHSVKSKASNVKNVRVRLKIDLKGKRHPNVFKKTVRVRINRRQIKKVLLRQILVEEKSSLRMLGVAVFYLNLLKKLKATKHDDATIPTSPKSDTCPFCNNQSSHNDESTSPSVSGLTGDLVEKLERDVKYLLNYAAKSTSKKEKAKYFQALETHGLVMKKSASQVCEVDYLKTSDKFLTRTNALHSLDVFERIEDVREIVQGKKEALRLLKMQVLKSRKCGVCDIEIHASKLASVLSSIDKTLSTL